MREQMRVFLARQAPAFGCIGRRPHRIRRRQRKHAMRELRLRQQRRITAWRAQYAPGEG